MNNTEIVYAFALGFFIGGIFAMLAREIFK